MNIKKINQMFLVTVLISLSASLMPLHRMFPDYGARLLFSELLLAAPGAAWIFAGKRNYARTVRLKRIHGSTALLLFLFYAAIMPVMSMINAVSMLYVENIMTDTMTQVISGHSYLLSMVLIALLPCILEESVYRGLFYNEYRKAAPVGGMLLSAFLFGIMHGNWNQFSYAFVMGMIFCLIVEATDSILSSMLLHFFINGASVTLLAMVEKLSNVFPEELSAAFEQAGTMTEQTLSGVLRTYLPAAVVGIAAAAVIYRQIALKEGRWEAVRGIFAQRTPGTEENAREPLFSVPLIVGIVILIALMILNEVLT